LDIRHWSLIRHSNFVIRHFHLLFPHPPTYHAFMCRWLLTGWVVAIAVGAVLSTAHAGQNDSATLSAVAPADIPALIRDLSDSSELRRTTAIDHLRAAGISARPALLQLLASENPQLRLDAANLLLRLPWTNPSDSDEVKQKMANYGDLSADARCAKVEELAQLPGGGGNDVLIRILCDDPCAAVRWWAAEVLRSQRLDTDHHEIPAPSDRLRALLTDTANPAMPGGVPDNAALLAAVGWSWHESDFKRADDLLRRAIDIEAKHPSALSGQMDFAYLWLIDRALDDQRYGDALSLLREQSARTNWDEDDLPEPVGHLFALHADQGPFAGWFDDLRTYRGYVYRPEMLYALARLSERHGPPLLDKALQFVALCCSGTSADRHYAVGCFLAEQDWIEPAEREIHLSLWLSDGESVNAWFQLARLAAERNDDLAVAHSLESALKLVPGSEAMQRTTQFGDTYAWTSEDAWAEVHWHYLRAARSANDVAGEQEHLEKLMELDRLNQVLHKDPGLATDIVPALEETGRHDDAKKCFDAAYKDLHDAIVADPNSAEAKNNLAWLCARCGWKLDEAVKLANEAIAAAPDNSAYLDTAAEANFRAGHADVAVQLETRALKTKPGDAFMTGQLRRFEAAEIKR
jgi:tetratricopeptide (TPR) repeat protein